MEKAPFQKISGYSGVYFGITLQYWFCYSTQLKKDNMAILSMLELHKIVNLTLQSILKIVYFSLKIKILI